MSSATSHPNHRDRERELLERYHRDGDHSARQEVVERSIDLVHYVARRYQNRGIAYEELVQAGSIGLLKAVDRFDLDRGVTLSTFAIPNILGEIRRYFRDNGWAMRVPRSIQENSAKVTSVTDRLTTKLQRVPTVSEIADMAELTVEQVLEAMEGARAYSLGSLDAPIESGEDDFSGHDRLGAEDPGFQRAEARLAVLHGMRVLRDRERQIIALRFGRDMTQLEIAQELGISQMHVSRLLRVALDDLRQELERRPSEAGDRPLAEATG
ncbi:RNA polymerase sigma-B factor [Paraconexibacter sp. AEG42_29]|uniref:RNA polymerase sigma-B factor n=1 Tax=Paraconexibacter sp. AEG42_29 TaxID=2997339 RepID=A0AAU7ATK0_9ACTN